MNEGSKTIIISIVMLFISISSGVGIWYLFKNVIDPIVIKYSNRIKELENLNKVYNFTFDRSEFSVNRNYDNKSNFNKVQPEDIFAHSMHNEIVYYTSLVRNIKRNIESKREYDRRLDVLRELDKITLPEGCHVPLFMLRIRESKLFKDLIQDPPTQVSFCIEMHYSSPKGKVQLHKSKTFLLHDMEVALESVARKTLDPNVRKQLINVERSEISDSLRYDVLNRDGFACVICGAKKSQGARLHVDHIVPVSRGGKSEISNLRTLCERCNIGKGAKVENISLDCEPKKIQKCPQCGGVLVVRSGTFGDFMGCSSYPKCRYTSNIRE